MSPGKVAELRELPDDELIDRLEGFKEELFALRFQLATGQLDNPMRIKQVRHDVARILTVLRQRHLEEDLEEQLTRADEEALERSREAQARGEMKGVSLRSMQEEALAEAEEGGGEPEAADEEAADEAEEEQQGEDEAPDEEEK